jgi:hypothetical protein
MRIKFILGILGLSLFFLLSLSPSVSALYSTTCAPDQTILRLSAPDDALGSSYDIGLSYPGSACFSTIFGQNYVPAVGQNPHLCNTSNRILFISPNPDGYGYLGANENFNLTYDLDGNGINDENDFRTVINCALENPWTRNNIKCDIDKNNDVDAVDVQLMALCGLGYTNCSVPLSMNTTIPIASPQYIARYDLNGDSNVNAVDVQQEINCVLTYSSGTQINCDLAMLTKADLNSDGVVNNIDLQSMIDYALGNVPVKEICYGDLICRVVARGCNADERLVLSMNTRSRSTLSATTRKSVQICCKSGQDSGCASGETLCGDGICRINCGNAICPAGTALCSDNVCRSSCGAGINCNNNNVCDIGEGCGCNDCIGVHDSCETDLICSTTNNVCASCPSGSIYNPATLECDICSSGFTYNPITKVCEVISEVIEPPTIYFCNQLKTQEDCGNSLLLNDNILYSIEAHSLLSNHFCFDKDLTKKIESPTCNSYISCSCVWDSGECKEKTERVIEGTSCPSLSPTLCITNVSTASDADCTAEQEYKVKWESKFNGGVENPDQLCASGQRTLPCPTKANLDFFNMKSFIMSILFIVIIYFMSIKIKKRTNEK